MHQNHLEKVLRSRQAWEPPLLVGCDLLNVDELRLRGVGCAWGNRPCVAGVAIEGDRM